MFRGEWIDRNGNSSSQCGRELDDEGPMHKTYKWSYICTAVQVQHMSTSRFIAHPLGGHLVNRAAVEISTGDVSPAPRSRRWLAGKGCARVRGPVIELARRAYVVTKPAV